MNEMTRQQEEDREAEKAANHFIRCAKSELPQGTVIDLDYSEADVDLEWEPFFHLDVSVPAGVEGISDTQEQVVQRVLHLAEQYGLLKQFKWTGSGHGFGCRDVSFIQKGRS